MSKIKPLDPVIKTYKLDAYATAVAITEFVDGIGNGLSREHELKLRNYIVNRLSAAEVKAETKEKKSA